MKTEQKIFDIKKLLCILAVVLPTAVRADYDDDNCRFFNPAYALCSVHSYNIGAILDGKPANPTDAEQISEMNEIIAMKATVIAQQMKQQYDFLNATIKRFKTQLEKAVLTSKMEILTGTSATGSSGSSGASSSSNGLSNAEDCDSYTGLNTYDCLVRNLSKIKSAIDKDITNARKQLDKDIAIMDDGKMCDKSVCSSQNNCKDWKSKSRNDLTRCIEFLQRNVKSARDTYETEHRYNRYPY